MRIRVGNWMLVLPVVLGLLVAIAAPAQEAGAAAGATAQVPPEVSQKAREYKGSPNPPSNLVKTADGHWTPYTPPEVPEGAQAYVIQSGDTLSQIAQQKLGSWLLWPQIWDANPYIKDAHWIYPGDPLFITVPQLVGGGEEVGMEEDTAKNRSRIDIDVEAPMPPVNANDIYCAGFIAAGYAYPTLRITSGPNRVKESLSEGDVVYLNGGTAEGVETGAEYFVIYKGQEVFHPLSGNYIGDMVVRVGRVKVLTSQEHSSIAQINYSCDEVRYGFALVPFSVIPIPWNIERSAELPLYLPDNENPKGNVIWTLDRLESTGRGSIAYVNLGTNHKLVPGDKLWVFRYPAEEDSLVESTDDLYRQQKIDVGPRDLFREKAVREREQAYDTRLPEGTFGGASTVDTPQPTAASSDTRLPAGTESATATGMGYRKFLGEAVVLTTQPNTACVKFILSSEEIHPGDWVQAQ